MTKLQELRKKKGLSQSQLAKAADVDIRKLQAYEQGLRDINKAQLQTAVALSRALGCNAEDLLEEREETEETTEE